MTTIDKSFKHFTLLIILSTATTITTTTIIIIIIIIIIMIAYTLLITTTHQPHKYELLIDSINRLQLVSYTQLK